MKNRNKPSSLRFRRAVSATALTLALGLTVSTSAQSGTGGGAGGSSSGASGAGGGAGGTNGGTRPQSPSTGAADSSQQTPRAGAAGGSSATASTSTSAESRKFIHEAAKKGMVEVQLSQLAIERTSNPSVRTYAETIVRDHQQANATLASIGSRRGIMIPQHTSMASTSSTSTGTSAGKMSIPSDSASSSGARSSDTGTATSRSTSGGQAGSQAPSGGSASARNSGTTGSSSASGTGAGAGSSGTYGATASAGADSHEMMEDVQKEVEKLSGKSGEDFDRAYVDHMVKGHKDTIDLFEDASERNSDTEMSNYAQTTLPTLRAHLSRAETLQRELKR